VRTYPVLVNVTLSVPDDLVARAREIARQHGTSLNSLIRDYLEELVRGGGDQELAAQFDALWQGRSGHSGGWRFNRDDLYAERVERAATA
jgi:Family of unknown function (DUF6364)